jgi:poly(A) polymerase
MAPAVQSDDGAITAVHPGAEPQGQLGPEPWLTAPETKAVFKALEAGGKPARFVGGCVRNALAHRPVSDIDIATPEPPERVMQLCRDAGLRVIPTGLDHGTVTVLAAEARFEVTTLRIDVDTDGRHATVAFTDDWLEDAKRRDFTINALSATRSGAVYDPFGGIADLAKGMVRFIGRADDRIAEDRLRVLRFFRFYAQFGAPPIDRAALDACRAAAGDLGGLARERIRDELMKLLATRDPSTAVQLMEGTGVWQALFPCKAHIGRLRTLAWLEDRGAVAEGVEPDSMRRLAAVSVRSVEDAEAMAASLKLSNARTDRLIAMAAAPPPDPEAGDAAIEADLYRFGALAIDDRAVLAWADEREADGWNAAKRTGAWLKLIEKTQAWTPPEFPVQGRDVLVRGVKPGPLIGRSLRRVEDWWIEQRFQPGREACLEKLDAVIADLSG